MASPMGMPFAGTIHDDHGQWGQVTLSHFFGAHLHDVTERPDPIVTNRVTNRVKGSHLMA